MAEDNRTLQAKLHRFASEILELSEADCQKIRDEIDSYRKQELDSYRSNAQSESSRYLKDEMADITTSARSELYNEKERLRKELFAQREEYMRTVFASAAAELRAFAQSDKYEQFMLENAERLVSEKNWGHCTLKLRAEDMKLAERLCKVFGSDCTAAQSSEISIGGIIVVSADGRQYFNESLDNALEECKGWFYHNSGLDITL